MTDAELIRAIQAGDETALPAFHERCLPVVWRYAYRRLGGNVHAAEDLVSETFLAAISAIKRLNPEGGTLCGWLLGIARHKLADRQRQAKVVPQEPMAVEGEWPSAPDKNGPSAILEAAEETQEVIRVLDHLVEDERIALEWKYLDGCSIREIAGRLGRTEKAVENLLYRARESFRALFGRRRSLVE